MKYIILKADDFKYDTKFTISVSWIRFLDYLMENNISASLGIIGNTIKKANLKFLHQVNYFAQSSNIEFFNHGYNHFLGKWFVKNISEFKNTPLWYQQNNILKTQELGKVEMDITFKTFGAPGNAVDDNTKTALERNNDIDVWFFGIKPSVKFIFDRCADAEFPTSNPKFSRFKEGITNCERDYAVLQLHPNTWDSHQFNEFKKIINFLKERNESYKFTTAYGYFAEANREKLLNKSTWKANV